MTILLTQLKLTLVCVYPDSFVHFAIESPLRTLGSKGESWKMAAVTLIFSLLFSLCGAAIEPEDKNYTASVRDDVALTWIYDNADRMFSVDWSFKSNTAAMSELIMTQGTGNNAEAKNGYNVEHNGDGNITLKSVTTDSSGTYFCVVTYDLISLPILPVVTGTATLAVHATTDAPPGCCCCLIDCKDIEIGVCYFANIMIYIIIFMVFSIIVGIVVEAIFNIWEKMNWTWMILSFVFFLFGLGFVICYYIKKKIAANEPDKNDSSNNSPGEIPLSKNQSHVMNTKYANPIGGQPDYAQPLQERPANFN